MKSLLWICVVASLSAAPREQAGDEKLDYRVYSGHFESNQSGLKGEESFLAFTDDESFRKVFGQVPPLAGKRFHYVKPEDFRTRLVVAAIKRGNRLWSYKVEKVTANDATLYVRYRAEGGKEDSARFASPLILSVDRGKYTSVVFLENGKKVGTARIKK